MKSENPHLAKSQFVLTIFSVLMIFVFGIVVDIWAGPPLGHGRRHPSRAFQGHHGQGFLGKGMCPQNRTTVQAPDSIHKQKNPLKKNPDLLYAGESLFQIDVQPTACKICHGVTGNGLGIMAQGMNPPPRNFTCRETMKTISDGQLFWIIRNGPRVQECLHSKT